MSDALIQDKSSLSQFIMCNKVCLPPVNLFYGHKIHLKVVNSKAGTISRSIDLSFNKTCRLIIEKGSRFPPKQSLLPASQM